jgi:chromosome segregation ATPase
VKEEVLEAEFTKAVKQLTFSDEALGWDKEALEQSHANERREREEAIARLQAEQTKLQRRFDAMYEDKLDGVIDADTYARKSADARAEQARLAEQIAAHQKAGVTYIDNLHELAKKAGDLFDQQPAVEKRKLLRYVVEGCSWKEGALSFCYKQPFEGMAEAALPLAA